MESSARLQALLGKYVHVRVTRPMGTPLPERGPEAVYGLNFGELLSAGGKPDGVFVMGIHHPVRLFDGRVIALVSRGETTYLVAAPRNSRYIVGQIRRALAFALAPEDYHIQCLYERSCGALVFRRQNGDLRYLLIKNRRSSNWGFPKGHVENRETPEQTARREVLEETGLQVRLLPGFACHSEYVIQGSIEKSVTIFLAEAPDSRMRIQEEEIEDYLWLNYQKAMRVLKFENDRGILRKANGFLRRSGVISSS